jgi:hypothetical protein
VQYFFPVIVAVTTTTIRTINIGTVMTYQQWTYAQVSLLWELARDEAAVKEIGFRVGKSCEEIRRKAEELGIVLKEKPVHKQHVSASPLRSATALKEQFK